MTPERIALAERFARRWGSFSDWDESRSVALRSVWRAERTWREGAGCTFGSWAAWYARARLMRLRRQQAIRNAQTTGFDPDWIGAQAPGESPDELRRAAVRAAVAALPGKQRLAVEWIFLEGLTQCEAARRLGTTRQAVAQLTQTGLEKVKRRLQADGEAPF